MLTIELLKKIRKIEISTKKAVSETFSGQYHSVFKGQGIEFSEVRPYIVGDEIRFVDWNVSARQNSLFVKRFVEERELTVFIIADVSGSTLFGSASSLKSEIIAEISSILAFSAIDNKDKVGAILFSDKIERYIPPKKGRKHVLSIISEIMSHKPQSFKTGIDNALRYTLNTLKRRSVIFLLSDFIDSGFEKSISIVSKKHDLIAIRLIDPYETGVNLPFYLTVRDPESDDEYIIDVMRYQNSQYIKRFYQDFSTKISDIFKKNDIDYLEVDISQDYIAPLTKFFKMRQKRNVR
ncbi:MAG: DUF58 domain-containing protein [Deltaproteobacteria bacterium]|nr:DUF58 domain-containing protein [Deltaproteobacteria bacterium]